MVERGIVYRDVETLAQVYPEPTAEQLRIDELILEVTDLRRRVTDLRRRCTHMASYVALAKHYLRDIAWSGIGYEADEREDCMMSIHAALAKLDVALRADIRGEQR